MCAEVYVNEIALQLDDECSQPTDSTPLPQTLTLNDLVTEATVTGSTGIPDFLAKLSDKNLFEIGFQAMTENAAALILEMKNSGSVVSWQKPLEKSLEWLHKAKRFSSPYTFLEFINPVLQHYETSIRQLFGIHQEHKILTEVIYCMLHKEFETRFSGKGLKETNSSVSVRFQHCRLQCVKGRQIVVIRDSCKFCSSLCVPCLAKWIKNKVYDCKQQVICLECSNQFTPKEVTLLLCEDMTNQSLQETLCDLGNYSNLTTSKTCPTCKHITNKSAAQPKPFLFSTDTEPITCESCQNLWCFKCHTAVHPYVSCAMNKFCFNLVPAWEERDFAFPPSKLQNFVSSHLLQIKARKCPDKSCSNRVSEVSQGAVMKCRCCHLSFCYWCKTVTDTCICDDSQSKRYQSQDGLTGAKRYPCVGVGRRRDLLRMQFVLTRTLYGNHSNKCSVFGCTRIFLQNRPILRKLIRSFIFAFKTIVYLPVILFIVAVLLGLSPIILIFLLIVGIAIYLFIAKRRRAIAEASSLEKHKNYSSTTFVPEV